MQCIWKARGGYEGGGRRKDSLSSFQFEPLHYANKAAPTGMFSKEEKRNLFLLKTDEKTLFDFDFLEYFLCLYFFLHVVVDLHMI